MIFHDKYELLALHGGDREIALPAREVSSGRDVQVHLLAAGYTPENLELLTTLNKLPTEQRRRVLDKGDHEGIPYVVTEVLPPTLKLREWLAAAAIAVPSMPRKAPGPRGVWKIPDFTKAPAASGTPVAKPGEFTRHFQPVKEPEPARLPEDAQDVPTVSMVPDPGYQAPATSAESQHGEFTRMLHPPPSPPPAPNAAAPDSILAPPLKPEAGELTRMLRSSSVPPPAPNAAAPDSIPAPPLEPEAGELTRMLRSSSAPPPPPHAAAPIPAPPVEPEAGKLTRMLRSSSGPPPAPNAAAPIPAPPVEPEAGEFTRILRSSSVPPPAPNAATPDSIPAPPVEPAAGEFTRMLHSSSAPPACSAQTPAGTDPGEFTRMLHSPPSPLSASNAAAPDSAPAPPVEPELGEFTRILSSSSVPPPPPPAAPPVPPPPARTAGPGEFTRMMQAPLASEPLRPAPKAQSHGISEFDRMMQADEFEPPPQDVEPSRPPEAPPARFMAAPSEFTRIFATEPQPSESLAASAPPPTPLPQGGAATGAFSRRSVAPARAADSGPSEFTRMFATPQTAAAAKTPAPMPASPPKADQSYMRLVLILAGLFLLIVVVIAVFAVIK